MKGREYWKKIDNKSNLVELLKMIKEISFKVNTGNNIYMKAWKVKQKTGNLFQKNDTT